MKAADNTTASGTNTMSNCLAPESPNSLSTSAVKVIYNSLNSSPRYAMAANTSRMPLILASISIAVSIAVALSASAAEKPLYLDGRSKIRLTRVEFDELLLESDLDQIVGETGFEAISKRIETATRDAIRHLGYTISDTPMEVFTAHIGDPTLRVHDVKKDHPTRTSEYSARDVGMLRIVVAGGIRSNGNIDVTSGQVELRMAAAIHSDQGNEKVRTVWSSASDTCSSRVRLSSMDISGDSDLVRVSVQNAVGFSDSYFASRRELAEGWTNCILPTLKAVLDQLPNAEGFHTEALSYAIAHSFKLPDAPATEPGVPTTTIKIAQNDTQKLMFAALIGNFEEIRDLLQHGVDVNARGGVFGDDNETALMKAVKYPAIVKLLIEKGADVNAANSQKNTPLHLACLAVSSESVELLINAKALVDAKNEVGASPLHYAVASGDAKSVLALLKAGADPNLEIVSDLTPLTLAENLAKYGWNMAFLGLFTRSTSFRPASQESYVVVRDVIQTFLKKN